MSWPKTSMFKSPYSSSVATLIGLICIFSFFFLAASFGKRYLYRPIPWVGIDLYCLALGDNVPRIGA
uniref:Uncharacterized protein n=1 Tax=Anguilla anguilla TaxID=7936 RepID=A0A0E9XDU9_ANGAN